MLNRQYQEMIIKQRDRKKSTETIDNENELENKSVKSNKSNELNKEKNDNITTFNTPRNTKDNHNRSDLKNTDLE